MAIDTATDGDPEDLRQCAQWLRGKLVPGISTAADDNFAARNLTESGWQGMTATLFSNQVDTDARDAFRLELAVESFSTALDVFADAMVSAVRGMQRARDLAAEAGLQVDGFVILSPLETPPPVSPAPATDHQRIQALLDQVEAYDRAIQQAERTDVEFHVAKEVLANVRSDLVAKWWIMAPSIANDAFAGHLGSKYASKLAERSRQAKLLAQEVAARHAIVPWGRADYGPSVNDLLRKQDDHRLAMTKAKDWERVSAKLRFAGPGLILLDVGYDLKSGKPFDKTIVSAAGGAAAALGAGAMGGAVAGSLFPVPIAGTIGGAVAGAVGGLFASAGLDAGYDWQVKKDNAAGRSGSPYVNMVKDLVTGGVKPEGTGLLRTRALLPDPGDVHRPWGPDTLDTVVGNAAETAEKVLASDKPRGDWGTERLDEVLAVTQEKGWPSTGTELPRESWNEERLETLLASADEERRKLFGDGSRGN